MITGIYTFAYFFILKGSCTAVWMAYAKSVSVAAYETGPLLNKINKTFDFDQ